MRIPCLLSSFALLFLHLIASAQSGMQCTGSVASVPTVRVEGVAELMGQATITCTGGTPIAAGQPIPTATVELTLNANITSRLLDTGTNRSEALLLVDDPQAAEQVEAASFPFSGSVTASGTGQYKGAGRPTVFPALQASNTTLRWTGVPLDAPGGGTRILRLVNIRANVNALGVGSLFSPSHAVGSVTISGGPALTLTSSQFNLATIQNGVKLTATPAAFDLCQPQTKQIPIVFTEQQSSAFMRSGRTENQTAPGQVFRTESGLFNTAFVGTAAGAGRATQGTLLAARFTGVPAGTTITVPVSGSNAAGITAQLVASGMYGSTTDATSGAVTLTGGAGTAVWEVTANNSASPQPASVLSFEASVTYPSPAQRQLGTATVTGGFGPAATSFAASADAAPRFLAASQGVTAFTVAACTGTTPFALSTSSLAFTATSNGATISPAQTVNVTTTGGTGTWTAASDSAWLTAAPTTGSNNGALTASIKASALPAAGTYTGKIAVTETGSAATLYLSCSLTVTSSGTGTARIVKVSGDGQLTMTMNGATVPLVVRVEDANGAPVSGKTVSWSGQGGVSFSGSTTTVTDANGLAQMRAIPGGDFMFGTAFLAYTITAASDAGNATFYMTGYPVTGSAGYYPPPNVMLKQPTQENRTIAAKLGVAAAGVVQALVTSGGGNGTNSMPIANVALNIATTNQDPTAGPVASCQGGTPLSGADGIVTCNLVMAGKTGTVPLLVNVGALTDFPGINVAVSAGDPVAPQILQGNGQSGKPGVTLPTMLIARTVDAYGNTLTTVPVTWTVSPAGAATLLGASTQSDSNGNVSAQVKLGATPGAVQVKVSANGQESSFTLTIEGSTPSVTAALSRTSVSFAATTGGAASTPAQDAFLTITGGTAAWSAVSDKIWLQATPASGTGSGKLTLTLLPAQLPAAGTYSGKVTITIPAAANSPLTLNYTLTVKASGSLPFGSFDTPTDGASNLAGSVAVTGWALDDIGVKQVTIWRDPLGSEPTSGNGLIYIGDALFVAGARPDVEGMFPSQPSANRAGWGYLMLTNGLPNPGGTAGNGTYKLHAFAIDQEGNQVQLGTKTIGVNNLASTKPFGTLDTPAPGQVVSGSIHNWGWALTPQPGLIAIDGSTVSVGVDGVILGRPLYGLRRADIAGSFPGYANSETGVGVYTLDTTRFANGTHTIGWLVFDNLGRGDGVGSRFFQVQNASASTAATLEDAGPAVTTATRALPVAPATRRPVRAPAYPAFRTGWDVDSALRPVPQAGQNLPAAIRVPELGRLELHLDPASTWTASTLVGDDHRELPIGSTFDADGGIFYWHAGPGFLGEFVLEFQSADGITLRIPVRIGEPDQEAPPAWF